MSHAQADNRHRSALLCGMGEGPGHPAGAGLLVHRGGRSGLFGADALLDPLAKVLVTLVQYSKARSSTGSVTPSSRCPTMLLTNRSRAASSKISRTSVPA